MLMLGRVKILGTVVVKYDGAPMRLDTGENVIQSDEVIARLLKAVNSEGVSMKRSPVLVKPSGVNAIGILAALKTSDWGIESSNAPDWIAKAHI